MRWLGSSLAIVHDKPEHGKSIENGANRHKECSCSALKIPDSEQKQDATHDVYYSDSGEE